MFLKLFILILLTETLVELAIKSQIFKPLRDKLSSLSPWLHELLHCGYCFSVWTSASLCLLFGGLQLSGIWWMDWGITALMVHRLSNYLHNFNDKWLDKYYDTRYVNTPKD